jgi:hypothetical protein
MAINCVDGGIIDTEVCLSSDSMKSINCVSSGMNTGGLSMIITCFNDLNSDRKLIKK